MNLIDIIDPVWWYLEEIKTVALINKQTAKFFKRDDIQKYIIKRDFGLSYEIANKYNFYTLYLKSKVAKYFCQKAKCITDLAIDIIYKFIPEYCWPHFLVSIDEKDIITAGTVCATMDQYSCQSYRCLCTESSGTKCCRRRQCPDDGDCDCPEPKIRPCLPNCDCRQGNRCSICRDNLKLEKCLKIKYRCKEAEDYYDQYCKNRFAKLIQINPYNFNEIVIDPDDPEIPYREEDYPEYRLYLFNRTYINRVKSFRFLSTFEPSYIYSNTKIIRSKYNIDFIWNDEPWQEDLPNWNKHYLYLYDQMVKEILNEIL